MSNSSTSLISADNEWSPLRSVIVGLAENSCFPYAPSHMIKATMPKKNTMQISDQVTASQLRSCNELMKTWRCLPQSFRKWSASVPPQKRGLGQNRGLHCSHASGWAAGRRKHDHKGRLFLGIPPETDRSSLHEYPRRTGEEQLGESGAITESAPSRIHL